MLARLINRVMNDVLRRPTPHATLYGKQLNYQKKYVGWQTNLFDSPMSYQPMGIDSCGERPKETVNKRPGKHHLPKPLRRMDISNGRQQQGGEMANHQKRADTPIDAEPCVK